MTFEEWFYEQQNFSLRAEWFWEDASHYQGDNPEILLKWLKAAYNAGWMHRDFELMDDGK